MVEIKSQWNSVKDKEKWAARGASFVAKAKATKVVWFPPNPVETGQKAAASRTKKETRRATNKTTGAAKKTTVGAAGAAKKTTDGAAGAAKKATNPLRRKKT